MSTRERGAFPLSLVLCVLALAGIGIIALSAISPYDASRSLLRQNITKQLLFAAVTICAIVVMLRIPWTSSPFAL